MYILSRRMICLLLLVASLSAAYFVYGTDWFQRKYIYPFPNKQLVEQYSIQHELNPFLVAAVIRTESNFLPNARSPRGAFGLMQMMPETAQWVAQETKEINFSPAALADPEVSIRMGTWYLAKLNSEFDGNLVLVLAAYNAGQGNVRDWMRRYDWPTDFADINKIPFKETREYVDKVLNSCSRYTELYKR